MSLSTQLHLITRSPWFRPLLVGGGILGVLALAARKASAAGTAAGGTATVTCTTPPCMTSGLNTRVAPNESAALVPMNDATWGTVVQVLEKGFPATAAAPQGWWKIQTPGGSVGYASAQYLR